MSASASTTWALSPSTHRPSSSAASCSRSWRAGKRCSPKRSPELVFFPQARPSRESDHIQQDYIRDRHDHQQAQPSGKSRFRKDKPKRHDYQNGNHQHHERPERPHRHSIHHPHHVRHDASSLCYMLRRYWPPTSKRAWVICPSEQTRTASISTANTFSFRMTAWRRRSSIAAESFAFFL